VRRGRRLEAATLAWNVAGVGVLAVSAAASRSVALTGFGLDSAVEMGASCALAAYLLVQSSWALVTGHRASPSPLGTAWTAVTAGVMSALAAGKARTGRALANAVLRAEGRVTAVDALLACAVVAGLGVDAGLGWWWADPVAGLVIAGYAVREARGALTPS
jgi:predicted Co/Zn/Cd cation transporter (cation efflux family)